MLERCCSSAELGLFLFPGPSACARAFAERLIPLGASGEELEQTREALADSQIRLHELEEKLALVEELLERHQPPRALPKGD